MMISSMLSLMMISPISPVPQTRPLHLDGTGEIREIIIEEIIEEVSIHHEDVVDLVHTVPRACTPGDNVPTLGHWEAAVVVIKHGGSGDAAFKKGKVLQRGRLSWGSTAITPAKLNTFGGPVLSF